MLLKFFLDKLEQTIHEQYKEIIANHEEELKTKWEDELQAEVNKTVDVMTMEYLRQLDEQERKLTELFKLELKYLFEFLNYSTFTLLIFYIGNNSFYVTLMSNTTSTKRQ